MAGHADGDDPAAADEVIFMQRWFVRASCRSDK